MFPAPGFTPESEVRAPTPGEIAVPAGARLGVRVEDALSTETSTPGDTFTATVLTPLRGPDGTVVIQEGAKVHGRVLAVEKEPAPSLKLVFETVDTAMGRRRLRATLASAADGTVSMELAEPRRTGELSLEGAGQGAGGGPPTVAGVGGDPSPRDEHAEPVVAIPEGVRLELVFVQPLRN